MLGIGCTASRLAARGSTILTAFSSRAGFLTISATSPYRKVLSAPTSSSPSPISPFNTPIPRRTMSTVNKSEEEWRAVLSPQQFRILRQKGTEPAGTGEYDKHKAEGVYTCAGCGTALYKSTTKFNPPILSGCGWPAFFDAIPGAVSRHEDRSWFMTRIEITCTACGGHLGHVFKGEGFKTPTDERHCVNSVSLKFHDQKASE
ncbi:hypothetical protein D9619_006347 [Psilocybe cf. subviscida]|uniref:Peptide-methionine (R)-S-oxide reductase n=1 Tax=Psilocybe cf. subviscida TaxID=2480587 RepID=A0A8H5B4M5_9AGAR|nr:hypothetical protein D9619_006347 [Psilocybe cf. subviscida]